MPVRWFRISFARNAFSRFLVQQSLMLDDLTPAGGIRSMLEFTAHSRPQHAHLDALECSWGVVGDRFEFAVTRRMQRDGQPESPLSLVFAYTATESRAAVLGRSAFTSKREATATAGYRAISRATPLARELRP